MRLNALKKTSEEIIPANKSNLTAELTKNKMKNIIEWKQHLKRGTVHRAHLPLKRHFLSINTMETERVGVLSE